MPKQADARSELGTGRIGKLVIRFAVPSIVAMLVTSLYQKTP